ncbi:hypothetical protein VP01_1082g3 [Puccinia sorghi]|uniref:Uncharacterized protein n=1 Tax=Puccinia sorghi TaxID=27349 RepID=A0A0L6VTK0_9BASI|nr:hypothetical protein VP01_1082g3 [Puccinia sorghi]
MDATREAEQDRRQAPVALSGKHINNVLLHEGNLDHALKSSPAGLNRQELCEALPYFRSYQGALITLAPFPEERGHYVSNRRTMGYLLDGCPAPRDVFEDSGRVIISHGGGGSTRTQPAGSGVPQLTLVKSQTRDNFRVKALQACQQRQFPVVLIGGSWLIMNGWWQAGKKYSGMPWIQKYGSVGYAVLGYYLVTHSWPEKEFMSEQPHNYCIRFKCKSLKNPMRRMQRIRFQWMSSQGDPWWLSDMEESLESCINGAIPPASMPQSPWLPEHDQQEDSCPGENVLGGWSTNDFQPGMDVESDSNTIVHEMASCTLMDSWEDGHPQGDNDVEMDCQATGLLDSSEEGHPEGDHGVEMDCETTVYSDTPDYEEMGKVEDEEPIQYTCNACGMDSLLIYQGCWMCLNEECEEFFQRHIAPSSAFHDGSTWTEGLDELRYVPWFLKHQQFLEKEERVPYQLKPRLTLQELDGHQRENFAAHLPRQTGFYCSSCGRLSVRIYWGALICSNAECQVGALVFCVRT